MIGRTSVVYLCVLIYTLYNVTQYHCDVYAVILVSYTNITIYSNVIYVIYNISELYALKSCQFYCTQTLNISQCFCRGHKFVLFTEHDYECI